MNRNVESHFATLPHANISRSTFDRNSSVWLTANTGAVVPFYIDEVLPADTFQVKTSKVIRMQSLITPIMSDLVADFYWFFVPSRLCWEHWREFMGETTESAWLPTKTYSIPQITSPASTGWTKGTIADYFGIPTDVPGLSVNALPFRGLALICNEWFRDENLTDPLNIPVSDSTVVGSNGTNYIDDVAKGGAPFQAAKFHDYFTSALPAPLKNAQEISLPISSGGTFPVVATDDVHDGNTNSLYFSTIDEIYNGSTSNLDPIQKYMHVGRSNGTASTFSSGTSWGATDDATAKDAQSQIRVAPINLWALDTDPQSATINQLRMAFQVQKFYETAARGGSRYIEVLRSHFGVDSPDGRLQRPEYLGGNRVPINVNQIIQQSETGTTPQGTPTGLSLTCDVHGDFIKSFVEHGYLYGLMVIRYEHAYQQGLERMWSREQMFDFYWPEFANLGEQAILNKEIYAQGSSVVDDDGKIVDNKAFGFQERWAEYRYKPNRVCAEMRSTYSQSLDVWHLGDDYSQLPTLSDDWIREDPSNVDRVIAVSQQNADQFFANIYVENRCTRAMPMYSIPGLIDHH